MRMDQAFGHGKFHQETLNFNGDVQVFNFTLSGVISLVQEAQEKSSDLQL